MELKKNDKYKKKQILSQIDKQWGYYEFQGNITIVKNCILNGKYNKIFQIIHTGVESLDGLFLINQFDINLHYDKNNEKYISLINKKFDKIVGYDEFSIKCLPSKKEYINWLLKEGYIEKEEVALLEKNVITKKDITGMFKIVFEDEF